MARQNIASSSQPESGGGVRTLTASDIVAIVGGELRGDASVQVSRIAPIDRAGAAELTFLASGRYASDLATCQASIVLVAPELADAKGPVPARVVVDRPHEAVLKLLPALYSMPAAVPGVHETARLGRGVQLGERVTIGPYVVLGDGAVVGDRCQIDAHTVVGAGASVGADSHLFPHVTLYAGTVLGNRVVAHSGARLGSDGFGYVFRDGAHEKIPHVGRCLIGDDVEIGANSTIDRGSIDDTVVGAGTKIDNLVQVGHNCRIGRLCLLMSQVGLAGSTRVGDAAILAGQVGIAGHVTIALARALVRRPGSSATYRQVKTWSGSGAAAPGAIAAIAGRGAQARSAVAEARTTLGGANVWRRFDARLPVRRPWRASGCTWVNPVI
ncbi:MAG: UDP-3-O-(3-hydroxymyristoyl)glucosamine N-acyltransferase [Gemmatimonadaceae bacterium]